MANKAILGAAIAGLLVGVNALGCDSTGETPEDGNKNATEGSKADSSCKDANKCEAKADGSCKDANKCEGKADGSCKDANKCEGKADGSCKDANKCEAKADGAKCETKDGAKDQ